MHINCKSTYLFIPQITFFRSKTIGTFVGVDVSVLSKHERNRDSRLGTATAYLLGQPRNRASIPGKDK